MVVREVLGKSILSPSKICPYALNPYVGCQHACSYCYARFMKRFTGHREPWGSFVDVKVNARSFSPGRCAGRGDRVWVSGVCDPYQPLEERYGITRKCLEILAEAGWPLVVQTRSGLVLRDRDVLGRFRDERKWGFRPHGGRRDHRAFEPWAPPIGERIRALGELHGAGIRTYGMIAPLLPGAEGLMDLLAGVVDHVLVDRMNYRGARGLPEPGAGGVPFRGVCPSGGERRSGPIVCA